MVSIFSKIVDGEIPCEKIYEDEDTLAFLSIGPINKGHAIVIPKKEYEDFLSTPPEVLAKMMEVSQKVARKMKEVLNCDGFNITTNNGSAAGQEVFHVHVHIIPRYDNDGLAMWKHKEYDEGEMKEFAQKLRL